MGLILHEHRRASDAHWHRAGPAIKVGAALSLSGPFAAHGRQAQRGLALWAEDANAAGGLVVRDRGGQWPVALVIYDDASRSAQAIAATEKLLGDERVDLLIGPYPSMLTLAVAVWPPALAEGTAQIPLLP